MHMPKMRFSLASAFALAAIVMAPLALADIGTFLPSRDGTYAQWTPSSGITHYTMVDELTCNGTIDYNRTTTVGQRDSYVVSVSGIPDGSKITRINITPCASSNSSGSSSTMKVFYRFNGTNSADAGNYALGGTTPRTLAATSFTGLSLIKSGSAMLEIGAIYTSGSNGVRLSHLVTVITYTTPLAAPSSLTARNSGTSILLGWVDNSTVENGFKIERSTDGGAYSQINTVGADIVAYTDSTVTVNHSYSYRVRAYNGASNSSYSNWASANTYTIPANPTNLIATASGAGNIALQWTDNATNETQYKLERKTGTVAFRQIRTLAANSSTYTDTGSGGLMYTYRVRAWNPVGDSGYSNEASVTLP